MAAFSYDFSTYRTDVLVLLRLTCVWARDLEVVRYRDALSDELWKRFREWRDRQSWNP